MPIDTTARPEWLTFDCYGTLIQWDEGLVAAVRRILARHGSRDVDPHALVTAYDRIEHEREQEPPFRTFGEIAASSLARAMEELRLGCTAEDVNELVDAIPAMPPFPEVPGTLRHLKDAGFRLCIISNTADQLIAGNIAQLGDGVVDRVVAAEQAGAYKPHRRLFEHAWRELGVDKAATCHICASPRLDHAAARDLGFPCIWIDRGTGRELLPDYRPDATLARVDEVPAAFRRWGWME